jgi:hypothetical protein
LMLGVGGRGSFNLSSREGFKSMTGHERCIESTIELHSLLTGERFNVECQVEFLLSNPLTYLVQLC